MTNPHPHIASWTKATDDDAEHGLGGYLVVEYGSLVLDGITVRRTADGRLALSFPARTDSHGHRHPLVRPVSSTAREAFERAVFKQLGVIHSEETTG